VRDGDGTAFRQQQRRHRLADDIRSPNDNGALATEIAEPVLQNQQTAVRRARQDCIATGPETPNVGDMEPVYILIWVDGCQNLLLISLVRQRQLNQDAINGIVSVEFLNKCQNIGFSCIGGQAVLKGLHATFTGLFAFVTNVDGAGRIITNQNHGQARIEAMGPLQARHLRADPLAQVSGKGFAVNDVL